MVRQEPPIDPKRFLLGDCYREARAAGVQRAQSWMDRVQHPLGPNPSGRENRCRLERLQRRGAAG